MAIKKVSAYSVFLHVLLIVQAVLLVALIQQNRKLQRFKPPAIAQLKVGETVKPVEVSGLDGEKKTMEWTESNQDKLLLIFTTTCPICSENLEAWRTLQNDLEEQVDVLGISLDEVGATRAFRDENDLLFPMFIPTDLGGFAEDYRISGVPTTILVGSGGQVRGAWPGRLDEQATSEVRQSVAENAAQRASMNPAGSFQSPDRFLKAKPTKGEG